LSLLLADPAVKPPTTDSEKKSNIYGNRKRLIIEFFKCTKIGLVKLALWLNKMYVRTTKRRSGMKEGEKTFDLF